MIDTGQPANLGHRKPSLLSHETHLGSGQQLAHVQSLLAVVHMSKSNFAGRPTAYNPCNTAHMDEMQDRIRAWIEHVKAQTGLDFTNIARAGKVSASTITRFMNNEDVKHTLTAKTLAKISEGTGIPLDLADPAYNRITMGAQGNPRLLLQRAGERMRFARVARMEVDAPERAAAYLGWDVDKLLRYEAGQEEAPLSDLVAFCGRFVLSADWLLLGSEAALDPLLKAKLRPGAAGREREQ